MSRMGERLMAAAQEALEHSEGKIELRTTTIPTVFVDKTLSFEEPHESIESLKLHQLQGA